MKVSIITPNRNGARYLETCIRSVLAQREEGVDLQYIFIDGASTDASLEIAGRFRDRIDAFVSEPDQGPASAINKGLRLAQGEIVGWLNADDVYRPGALRRVVDAMQANPGRALCFGRCPIVDEDGREIRRGITKFKEMFFPVSSRFTIQCINYISQPAAFFRRPAVEKAGHLREDLKAAFDYDFILRLWRHGGAARIGGAPLAAFRWHESSISGRGFARQFREEFDAAVRDAGRFSLQALIHLGVRWGIVGSYSLMALARRAGR